VLRKKLNTNTCVRAKIFVTFRRLASFRALQVSCASIRPIQAYRYPARNLSKS